MASKGKRGSKERGEGRERKEVKEERERKHKQYQVPVRMQNNGELIHWL